MMRRLLIGIGPPRTGTTFVFQAMRQHPRVRCALNRLKEIHYFDALHWRPSSISPYFNYDPERNVEARNRLLAGRLNRIGNAKPGTKLREEADALRRFLTASRSDEWYESAFAAGDRDWCLDISPSYCMLPPKGFEHMRRVARELRILVTFRDPVERIKSQLRALHKLGRIDLTGRSAESILKIARMPYIETSSDYLTILLRVRRMFKANEIQLVFFEDLIADPGRIIGGLCKAMNIPKTVAPDRISRDSTSQIHLPAVDTIDERLRHRWRDMLRNLAAECSIPRAWRDRYSL